MRGMRCWTMAALAALLAAGGCSRSDHDSYDSEPEEARPRQARAARPRPAPPVPARPMTAADSAAVRARIAARADSLRATFGRATPLRWREVWGLRRDVNAEQIATAQSLGVRVSGKAEIARLVSQGRLVALGDSTPYWVLRKMEHSVPYLTPDAHAMLERLGRRFHERLDSLGLPRYRMKVTSVLRTDETQAALRKINANASQTVSAHEFGTTLDVSHERFAVPAPTPPGEGAAPAVAPGHAEMTAEMEDEMLEEVGKEHAKVLQAELGRAIADLREQGALHVMMEDAQPVYHMTVARRFTATAARP